MTGHHAPSAASEQLARLALELGVEPLAARLKLDPQSVRRLIAGQRPGSRLRQRLAGAWPHVLDRCWQLAPVAAEPVPEPEPTVAPNAVCKTCGRPLGEWCKLWP